MIRRLRSAMLVGTALALSSAGAFSQAGDSKIADKVQICAACHGQGGNSTDPQYPILAGQTSRYLYLQLKDFKEGRRQNDLMTPLLADLSKDDMRDIAQYFSEQKVLSNNFKPNPEKAKLGAGKADEVLCTMCHLGGFKGQNEIPKVAGQHYRYIVKQLQDFKAKKRTNDAGNMTSVSGTLTDDDIENLAHFLAGLY
jgi:cytochrome c553